MKHSIQSASTTGKACRPASFMVLAILLVLAGCESTGPKLDNTSVSVPGAYRNAIEAPPPGRLVRANWWTLYGSEELNHLVDRSLAYNADLRVATLQVAQAKIRVDQARAGLLPFITAPVRAVVQSQGTTTDSQQNSQAGLTGTFRLDVWGEQRGLVDSAELQLARAIHERENVQRNTIGALVTSYIAYLSVSDSILIARENEAVAADILRSFEQRLELGDATADELEQQKAVLFSQQVVLPGLENQQDDLRSAISRLVGALPGNLVLSERGLDALQLPVIKTGLPSALLLDRPDIRMMEARMRAANANINVARARLLPPVDLAAQLSYSGANLANLLQPQNFLASTAASLVLAIFDGGLKKGEQAFAQSFYEEMVETYGKTVLQAVRDVESAIANLRAANRRLDAQKSVTRAALQIYKLTNEAFAAGAIDQGAVLEHRRSYQRSADEAQRMRSEVLRSYATLAYALGLGSVLSDGDLPFEGETATLVHQGCDLSVGISNGLPVLIETAPTLTVSPASIKVALPGIFHRSALLPMWRDFQYRLGKGVNASIVAQHVDHVDHSVATNQSWYRLSLVNFPTKLAAVEFCARLVKSGQGCNSDAL